MKRMFLVAAAAATGGAVMLGGAAPAMASGPSVTVTPDRIYEDGSFTLEWNCPAPAVESVFDAAADLFNGNNLDTHPPSGKRLITPDWLEPRTYEVILRCYGEPVRKTGEARTSFTILPGHRPVPPPPHRLAPPAPDGRGGTARVRIATGFGGMARTVAAHHPGSLVTGR